MRIGKATLKVFGKTLEYCGPGQRWRFPGGWIYEVGRRWHVCCYGVTAIGDSPELAVRRLNVKVLKVVEAIG